MNKLLSIRELKGLSQQELADKSGVDISLIRDTEDGKIEFGVIPITEGLRLGKALGVTVEEML